MYRYAFLSKNVVVLFMLFLYCETILWGRVEGSSCWRQEREALLDLQKAVSTIGESVREVVPYNKSDPWFTWDDEVADCCKWQGVECDQHSGRVIRLLLHTCEGTGAGAGASKIDDSQPPILPVHCYYTCRSSSFSSP